MEMSNYLNYVADVANKIVKSNKGDVQIIDGIAEIEINGIEYQAQIVLEPNKRSWVDDDKPTIRKTVD